MESLIREESWGRIRYDFVTDTFSAEARRGENLILSAPIGIGWIIIGGCNLKCIHCYGNAEELSTTVLSTAECFAIIDRIVEAKVMRVVISGGEPLLRSDIFRVITELSTRGVSTVLGTNGSFLEETSIELLKQCTRVEMSLDAANAGLNNRIRPSRQARGNAWEETLRAIRLCTRHGVKVRVLTALNCMNIGEIHGIARVLHESGISDWAISETIAAGRARRTFPEGFQHNPETASTIAALRDQYPSITIRTSARSRENRYYALILPDGQLGTEDVLLGKKISYGSLFTHSIQSMWMSEQFSIQQHFEKWIGNRVKYI